MNIENEIKVLDIDPAATKKLLRSKGFEFVGLLDFKRYVFSIANNDTNSWLRLRTDGITTTLTYKKVLADRVDGVHELEIVVSDLEKTRHLLEAAGLKVTSYQENSRELYKKDGVEAAIDRWPLIPVYLEIEAKTKGRVIKVLQDLGFTNSKTTSLPTKDVYKMYGKNLDKYKELKF